MMRENPQKRCRGETENGRESGCRNKKRRRKNIDTVGVKSNQQDEYRTLESSRGAVKSVYILCRVSIKTLTTKKQDTYIYIYTYTHSLRYLHSQPPILSRCPLHTNSGYRKREAHINWSMVTCKGSIRDSSYVEDYLIASADGTSAALNAIGTQLRDSTNSGLARWRVAV